MAYKEHQGLVIDGRIDKEKLYELLRSGEQTQLEYKEIIDLSDNKDKLNFVKDVVAMSNRSGGGYILIGVQDDGTPCLKVGELDLPKFDGARLGDTVRRYIETQIRIHSQPHVLDNGCEVLVVRVEGHADGLPVPMAMNGQYHPDNGKKPIMVFREGDLLVREGAANVQLRHTHWKDVLALHDENLRTQAMRDAQLLIKGFVEQLQLGLSHQVVPLTLDMDNETFASAVVANIDAGEENRVRRIVAQASRPAQYKTSENMAGMNKITIVALQSLFCENHQLFKAAVDALFKIYLHNLDRKEDRADFLVRIITRIYVLGAFAIRNSQWTVLSDLVLRPIGLPEFANYQYSSWIRHGQVAGSRSESFDGEHYQNAMLISAAKAFSAEHPWARPDLEESEMFPVDELRDEDEILNSLCQFDAIYCLLVEAKVEGQAGAYPSFSVFHQYRAVPVFTLLTQSHEIREAVFTTSMSDNDLAEVMSNVLIGAKKQAMQFGNWDWGNPPAEIASFIETNRSAQS